MAKRRTRAVIIAASALVAAASITGAALLNNEYDANRAKATDAFYDYQAHSEQLSDIHEGVKATSAYQNYYAEKMADLQRDYRLGLITEQQYKLQYLALNSAESVNNYIYENESEDVINATRSVSAKANASYANYENIHDTAETQCNTAVALATVVTGAAGLTALYAAKEMKEREC